MQKAEAGEIYEPEVKEWEEIPLPEIRTDLIKFVVCIDFMGQDREFTADEKKYALDTVYKFRCHWEEFEKANLVADRDALVEQKTEDAAHFNEELMTAQNEKQEEIIQKALYPELEEEEKDPKAKGKAKPKEIASDDEEDEKTKFERNQLETSKLKMKYIIDLLKDEKNKYKDRFGDLPNRKVVKL